jgi:hypothetical protein
MKFEDDLRAALGRVDAPNGFAARVVARARLQALAADKTTGTRRAGPTRRSWMVVLATAASLALATSSGLVFLEQQKRETAERARALAVQALRLASTELQQIHSRVVNRRANPSSDDQPSKQTLEPRQ